MKFPWVALYPAEYISKTRTLTMKQHGAYFLLLLEYYTNGPLVANATALLNVCGGKTEEDRDDILLVLNKFFICEEGFWHNKRADEEIKKRSGIRKQMQLNGRKGGLAKASHLLQQKPSKALACLQSHNTKESNNHKGGENIYSSEKIAPPPQKFTQQDFDERDLRKLAEAQTDLLKKLGAQVGYVDQMTEDQFFEASCEIAGLTVQRGLKLKEIQKVWPK